MLLKYIFKCIFKYIFNKIQSTMAIQRIKANKTASLTDLRDPMKVIEAAGNEPVAIMNRNQVVGYFVPEASTNIEYSYVSREEFDRLLPEVLEKAAPVLDYLKDR